MTAASDRARIRQLEAELQSSRHAIRHLVAAIAYAVRVLRAYERMSGEDVHSAPRVVRQRLSSVLGEEDGSADTQSKAG